MTWNDLRLVLLTLGVVVALYALFRPSDLLGLQAISIDVWLPEEQTVMPVMSLTLLLYLRPPGRPSFLRQKVALVCPTPRWRIHPRAFLVGRYNPLAVGK
jgi:hypothetical protein